METKNLNERKVVEYVCTGNHGRSPMAAAIANTHAKDLKVESRIDIRSAGSAVTKFITLDFPTEELLPYIDKALTKGFLTEYKDFVITETAKKAIQSKGADITAVRTIIARMADFEECYRNVVISEMLDPETRRGIVVVPHVPKQLVKSDETDFILTMGASNKKVVVEIYGRATRPIISTLGEFTGSPTVQIPDPFGGTLQEYRDIAEALKPLIRRSLELILV